MLRNLSFTYFPIYPYEMALACHLIRSKKHPQAAGEKPSYGNTVRGRFPFLPIRLSLPASPHDQAA